MGAVSDARWSPVIHPMGFLAACGNELGVTGSQPWLCNGVTGALKNRVPGAGPQRLRSDSSGVWSGHVGFLEAPQSILMCSQV